MTICEFRKNHPRLWAVAILLPCLLVTVVVMPVCYLYDVVSDMPRVFCNLFGDLWCMFAERLGRHCRTTAEFWKAWFAALCGKDTTDEKEGGNDGNE